MVDWESFDNSFPDFSIPAPSRPVVIRRRRLLYRGPCSDNPPLPESAAAAARSREESTRPKYMDEVMDEWTEWIMPPLLKPPGPSSVASTVLLDEQLANAHQGHFIDDPRPRRKRRRVVASTWSSDLQSTSRRRQPVSNPRLFLLSRLLDQGYFHQDRWPKAMSALRFKTTQDDSTGAVVDGEASSSKQQSTGAESAQSALVDEVMAAIQLGMPIASKKDARYIINALPLESDLRDLRMIVDHITTLPLTTSPVVSSRSEEPTEVVEGSDPGSSEDEEEAPSGKTASTIQKGYIEEIRDEVVNMDVFDTWMGAMHNDPPETAQRSRCPCHECVEAAAIQNHLWI